MVPRIFFFLITLTLLIGNTVKADEKTARSLLLSQGCRSCHFLDGSGGTLGPNLDRVGSSLKPFQIEQKLLEPALTNPDSVMPSYKHLKEHELKALVDFLETRTKRK